MWFSHTVPGSWKICLEFLARLWPRCLPTAFGKDLFCCVQPTQSYKENGGLWFQAIRLPSGFSPDRGHYLGFMPPYWKPKTEGLTKATHITDFILHFADMQQHGCVVDGGVASGSGLVIFQLIKYLQRIKRQEGTKWRFSIYNLKYKWKVNRRERQFYKSNRRS